MEISEIRDTVRASVGELSSEEKDLVSNCLMRLWEEDSIDKNLWGFWTDAVLLSVPTYKEKDRLCENWWNIRVEEREKRKKEGKYVETN